MRDSFTTVVLATTSPAGEPDASVVGAALAPDLSFRVFVSGLATHTRNLLDTGRVSVLLLEDESAAPQPLARRRLTWACTVAVLRRDHSAYPASLPLLRDKLGLAFDLLPPLGDFQMLRLSPQRGRLVVGFGEAYEVAPHDWTLLTPVGPAHPSA
jgi:putative heme iron utilization protein